MFIEKILLFCLANSYVAANDSVQLECKYSLSQSKPSCVVH